MKFLSVALLALTTTAFAAEMTILDVAAPELSRSDIVSTKFKMDKTTGEGSADITVSREIPAPWTGGGWTSCTPYGGCLPPQVPRLPEIRLMFKENVAIEGLSLMGDRIIFASDAGDIDCGSLRNSPVLRVPTIYLSGKCRLSGMVKAGRLTVKFKTK